MTDEEAWVEMWRRKNDGCEMFAQATLTRDVEFTSIDLTTRKQTKYQRAAGCRVLITLISRLGHVCIRGTAIDKQEHGYRAGVEPEALTDIRFLAEPGVGWRKELRDRIEKSKEQGRG